MEMPTSLTTLLIAVLGVLPGVPGDQCYRVLMGRDWREDRWQATLRLLGFSVTGLAIYCAFAPHLKLPLPPYVVPGKLENVTSAVLNEIGVALLGQTIAGVLAAVIAAGALRLVARTSYLAAWDHFVNVSIRNRWVVVAMKSGESYLGYVGFADTSVKAEERDLVLHEPARLDVAAGTYIALDYSSVFVLGSAIASIGAVADPHDRRNIPAGTVVSASGGNDAKSV